MRDLANPANPASIAQSAAFNASPVTSGTTQASSKVAVIDSAAFIVTSQLPIPEQPAPDQPANDEPGAAVAVKDDLGSAWVVV